MCIVFAAAFSSTATPPSDPTQIVDGTIHLSDPKERLADFLLRLAPSVVAYTNTHQWELCARVCSNGQQYALVLRTQYSGLLCSVATHCPHGFAPTTASVHSHPSHALIVPTALDKKLMPQWAAEKWVWMDPFDFSETDKMAGNVWLWSPDGRLLHVDLAQGFAPHPHSALWPSPFVPAQEDEPQLLPVHQNASPQSLGIW